MFAAIPALILLGIIPRCVGKTQRGGRVGWAGGLVPLRSTLPAHISPPSDPPVAFCRTGGGLWASWLSGLRGLRAPAPFFRLALRPPLPFQGLHPPRCAGFPFPLCPPLSHAKSLNTASVAPGHIWPLFTLQGGFFAGACNQNPSSEAVRIVAPSAEGTPVNTSGRRGQAIQVFAVPSWKLQPS